MVQTLETSTYHKSLVAKRRLPKVYIIQIWPYFVLLFFKIGIKPFWVISLEASNCPWLTFLLYKGKWYFKLDISDIKFIVWTNRMAWLKCKKTGDTPWIVVDCTVDCIRNVVGGEIMKSFLFMSVVYVLFLLFGVSLTDLPHFHFRYWKGLRANIFIIAVSILWTQLNTGLVFHEPELKGGLYIKHVELEGNNKTIEIFFQ